MYSYELMCVDYKYDQLKYLAAAFLPLTIFQILVALRFISFTSPLLNSKPNTIEGGSISVTKVVVVTATSIAAL